MTPTRVLFPVPVERDKDGNWKHPETLKICPTADANIPLTHPVFTGVEVKLVFNDDGSEEVDYLSWQPSPPDGDGWFLCTIGINDGGAYFANWARPTYKWLLDTCAARKKTLEICSKIINDQTVAMQSAIIESEHGKGTEAGMRWIWQALCGPGLLPDDEDDCGTDAQAWYDNNCYDALTEKQKKIEPAHSATATRRSREQS